MITQKEISDLNALRTTHKAVTLDASTFNKLVDIAGEYKEMMRILREYHDKRGGIDGVKDILQRGEVE